MPPAALLHLLMEASQSGRTGQTVLLSLACLGENGAGLADRTSVSLVEESPEFCEELVRCVTAHEVTRRLLDAPLILRGTFAEHRPEILDRPVYRSSGRVATA